MLMMPMMLFEHSNNEAPSLAVELTKEAGANALQNHVVCNTRRTIGGLQLTDVEDLTPNGSTHHES